VDIAKVSPAVSPDVHQTTPVGKPWPGSKKPMAPSDLKFLSAREDAEKQEAVARHLAAIHEASAKVDETLTDADQDGRMSGTADFRRQQEL
jgi:hypothetical protein